MKRPMDGSIEVIQSMYKRMRTEDIVNVVDLIPSNSANPFRANKDTVFSMVTDKGEVMHTDMKVKDKMDLSDYMMHQFILKPYTFTDEEDDWYTTDASAMVDYARPKIMEKVNLRIPSTVTINGRVLYITTAQALIVMYMATPVIRERSYAMKFDPEKVIRIMDDPSVESIHAVTNKVIKAKIHSVRDRCRIKVTAKRGSFQKMHVLSVGTGCGKTMMACMSTALCMIEETRWNRLKDAFKASADDRVNPWSGVVVDDLSEPPCLVRACMVFSPQNLASQWMHTIVGTVKSLIEHIGATKGGGSMAVYVWDGKTGATKVSRLEGSDDLAVQSLSSMHWDYPKRGNFNMMWFYKNVQSVNPDSVLYWVLPLQSSSISELQAYPSVSYACQIFDEYTVSLGKHNHFSRSVCTGPTIITQATLSGLVDGMLYDEKHPLRLGMGGINRISNHVDLLDCASDTLSVCFDNRKRVMNSISLMTNEIKRHALQAMFITPYFLRRFLSLESRNMMVESIEIFHVTFQPMTLSNQMGITKNFGVNTMSKSEFVQSIMSGVVAMCPPNNSGSDHAAIIANQQMQLARVHKELKTTLFTDIDLFRCGLEAWISENETLFVSMGKLRLLHTRLDELKRGTGSCPICFSDDVSLSNMKITSCCMACLCSKCFFRCARCPNCRSEEGFRNVVEGGMLKRRDATDQPPPMIRAPLPGGASDSIKDVLIRECYAHTDLGVRLRPLFDVVSGAFRALITGVQRPRIVFYFNYTTYRCNSGVKGVFALIDEVCGPESHVYDMESMSHRKNESQEALEKFHSDDAKPVIWVCSSHGESKTFAGLDLYDMTGMIICDAHLDTRFSDQILGRVTRMTSDASRHRARIPVINIVS